MRLQYMQTTPAVELPAWGYLQDTLFVGHSHQVDEAIENKKRELVFDHQQHVILSTSDRVNSFPLASSLPPAAAAYFAIKSSTMKHPSSGSASKNSFSAMPVMTSSAA